MTASWFYLVPGIVLNIDTKPSNMHIMDRPKGNNISNLVAVLSERKCIHKSNLFFYSIKC